MKIKYIAEDGCVFSSLEKCQKVKTGRESLRKKLLN